MRPPYTDSTEYTQFPPALPATRGDAWEGDDPTGYVQQRKAAVEAPQTGPRICPKGHPMAHATDFPGDRGWVCPVCHPASAEALGIAV